MAIKKIKNSKYSLSASEQKMCHGIIHTASVSSGTVGAGLAQLPLADNAVITPIQVGMIVSLGKVFDQEITKTVAKGLLTGFIANFVGRGVAQAAWGWVPGIGNASNAITAAAITESIGWLCVDHFYKEKYLRGKEIVKETGTGESDIVNHNNEVKTSNDERYLLKKRAKEFINGDKDIVENNTEFNELLDDFTRVCSRIEDQTDELHSLYRELCTLI